MAGRPLTTLLLDADIIAYKFAAAGQDTFRFDPEAPPCVSADDFADVAEEADKYIAGVAAQLKADKLIVCLSCPSEENWRLGVLPSYKANRKDVVKPVHLAAVKEHFAANYPTYQRPTLEADDVMGILSTHPHLVPGKKIIVSEDKDMKTIPGWLFNPRKDTQPRRIDEQEANYWHLHQTLVGDTTDNYKGCPGVGPVNAERLLHSPNGELLGSWSSWQAVLAAFILKEQTEADALVQARVARICRHTDYDFKRKEVKLWEPPPSTSSKRPSDSARS